MDNLTHTLVGFALADSGLKRRTRLGTATLVIGANLPDIDGLVYLLGTGTDALAFRRGWTHGILAMVALPLALAGLILGWGRIRRGSGPPLEPRWILALAGIGVLSHPLLDLLNTYGVRLLMPFSDRWFYGDTLFIIDPWVWAVLLAGILGSRLRERRDASGASDPGRPARVALALCLCYVVAMALSSRIGAGIVEREAGVPQAQRTMVGPVFLDPFRRDVIRDLGTEYEEGELTWYWPPHYRALTRVPVRAGTSGIREAAVTPAGGQFLLWSRFPCFHAEPSGDSIRVRMSDLRYSSGTGGGWASVDVMVKQSPQN